MKTGPSVSVGRLLGGAALLGVIAGVVLSARQQGIVESDLESVYDNGGDLSPPNERAEDTSFGDAMRADPETLRAIPPYPGGNPRRLSSPPTFQNAELGVAWFSTEDAVGEVLSFYDNAFRGLPTPVVSYRFSSNSGYSGFYEMPSFDAGHDDFMAGKIHLVSAVRSGSQTLVFISNSEPSKFLDGAAILRGDIDLPPNALRPQVVAVGEGPVKRRTVFSMVPNSNLDEVTRHFEAAFAKGGWKLGPWVSNDDGSVAGRAAREEKSSSVLLKMEGSDVRLLLTLDSRDVITSPLSPVEVP